MKLGLIRNVRLNILAKLEKLEGYSYLHYFSGLSFKNWSIGILYRKKKAGNQNGGCDN